MSCKKSERSFKSSDAKIGSAECYDFVLMDGSKAIFAACLNSGLSKQIRGYNIYPGASITVTDWDFIQLCHCEFEPIMNHVVMFIKGFSWTLAPSVNTFNHPEISSADKWTTDTFQKALFDFDLVGDVETKKSIRMWTMDKKKGSWYYACLQETGVVYGYWICHAKTKHVWKQQLANQKKAAIMSTVNENKTKCTCRENYDLRQCVLTSYPIGQVCKQDIYEQVVE
jgi:hypothetical protein